MKRQWLDSIAAQALAALVLAVVGAAVWAMVLWHLGKDEGNRWHSSIRQEMAIYHADGDLQALGQRLDARGIETTAEPPPAHERRTRRELREGKRLKPGERIWVRLPTHPSLWAAIEPRSPPKRFNVWAWSGGMALLLMALAWWLAWYWIRPLRKLSQSAGDIVLGKTPPSIHGPWEIKQLAGALERAACQANAASEERKIFLAGVSHDLRQPLARIQMALAIQPLEDAQLQAGVERDLQEMDGLLSQFVEWVRDGQDEEIVPVDLRLLCEEVAISDIEQWSLDLPQPPACVMAPPTALRRAISNLLHNAGKHGQAPFQLRLVREPGSWVVEIKDQGPTVPPGNVHALLEPFTGCGARAGAGLGLAVAHRVAKRMGGNLEFRAGDAGRGWHVRLCLPVTETP